MRETKGEKPVIASEREGWGRRRGRQGAEGRGGWLTGVRVDVALISGLTGSKLSILDCLD